MQCVRMLGGPVTIPNGISYRALAELERGVIRLT